MKIFYRFVNKPWELPILFRARRIKSFTGWTQAELDAIIQKGNNR